MSVRPTARSPLLSLLRIAGASTLGVAALVAALTRWGFHEFRSDLPDTLGAITDYRPLRANRIFSVDGELIAEFFVHKRVLLPPSEIPPVVQQAFVAAQDARSITRQVARLLIADQEHSLARTLREALLAYRIERHPSKDQVLSVYLNHVYMGHGAYGIVAAANAYFGKLPADLTGAEAAMLARLPGRPGRLPALQDLPSAPAAGATAAVFVETVRRHVAERYGGDEVLRRGLRIHTTLDMRQQRAAEAAVRRGLDEQRRRPGSSGQGALVAVDPSNGHLLAMVGGHHQASQAGRPVGSIIDPFIYAAAIDAGMTPVTIKGRGPASMTLATALAHANDAVSAQLMAQVGMDPVVQIMRGLGIRSKLPPAPPLGRVDLGLAEVSYALAALPAGGKRVDPVSILRILDAEGRTLEDHSHPPPRLQKLSPETAFIVTAMLKGVVESETEKRALTLERPAAGSNGRSTHDRDAWFIGFTPELLCGVWVGGNGKDAVKDAAKTDADAVSIWLRFMQAALEGEPVRDFPVPSGVVLARGNPETGLPAPPSQIKSRLLPFKRGTLPPAFTTATTRRGQLTDARF